MPAMPMEICPLCAMCPRLTGRMRLQVRCGCGACGPRMRSPDEAIGRWNSVVSFMRQLKARGVEHADARDTSPPAGVRRFLRRLTWQYGLEPHQGC